jgi:hypothetical protein
MRLVYRSQQTIGEFVEFCRATAIQISPARSGARTAEIYMAAGNKVPQNTLI